MSYQVGENYSGVTGCPRCCTKGAKPCAPQGQGSRQSRAIFPSMEVPPLKFLPDLLDRHGNIWD
jgi:hypothetical protein